MNKSHCVHSLKFPAGLFSFALVMVACGQPASETLQGPQEEGLSRYPVTAPTQEIAPDSGPNPWVSGSGGESSGAADPGTPSGGAGSALVDSGTSTDPNRDSESDSESALHGTGGGTQQANDGDPVEGDPEVDEELPLEPLPLLQRRLVRYLEGEGTDKLLGFWGAPGVSPVECRVEIYSNGGTDPWRSIPLPNEFPEGGSLTLCSLPENHPECTANLSGSLYNGNDALVLVCGDVVLDAFGRVGEDPGEAWTNEDETLSTEGQDLVRCGDEPRPDPFSPFELVGEWVRVENGESPEEARLKCALFEAPVEGGAGAFAF